jgi:acetolactate synthase-1/2/3 large subunit
VVNCEEYHTYEPKIIGWETPIEDMYPYIPREEFYSNMIVEPLACAETPFMPSIFNKGTANP